MHSRAVFARPNSGPASFGRGTDHPMLIFRYRVSSCDSVVSAAAELHLDMSPVRVWPAWLDDYAKGLSQCKRRDLSDEDKPYDPGNAESEDVHHRI